MAGQGVRIEIPVRWGDMDCLGHVNNTRFFQYCESARIAYFEALDLDGFKERPTDGPGLVAAQLNFRRQVKYPATVAVQTNITRLGGRSFTLSYRLTEEPGGHLVADGTSVNVWVDYAAEQAMPLPAALIDAMVRLDGNEIEGLQRHRPG